VWKNKLIFVETPDANETSIALENYRRVGNSPSGMVWIPYSSMSRLVTMAAEPFFYPLHEARCLKASILTTIMAELSSCLGMTSCCLMSISSKRLSVSRINIQRAVSSKPAWNIYAMLTESVSRNSWALTQCAMRLNVSDVSCGVKRIGV
jgi:hypothetical protein